ncbi:GntR family transcriptional regulator [Cryptosporangium aurantiacum]|uniref:Transcriptional regulator, GntR family n=1 Tax=Cryptosporangium aurantiacum TaxID=134849 RepID=A0A1M7R3H5_9ACTN|nr:GntR family transcriptional regulator [Cryptosporangium aurantiacum]SHN39551.1 transcriptional regulator, GntR family [Cryptosporangium aurantiacum]
MTSASIVGRAGSRRQGLPDEVATYVRELILSGQVRPGEFIRMDGIAEAVGVSNTPVREGLLKLSNEGWLVLEPRRGFVVAEFSAQDVQDLFWAQAQLAGELAARTAKAITPDRLERLSELIERHEQAVTSNQGPETIDALNHAFHREVNLGANSPYLARLLSSVAQNFPNRFYSEIEGQVQACRVEHPLILDALRRRKARTARQIMQQHILSRGTSLVAMLEERGIFTAEQ